MKEHNEVSNLHNYIHTNLFLLTKCHTYCTVKVSCSTSDVAMVYHALLFGSSHLCVVRPVHTIRRGSSHGNHPGDFLHLSCVPGGLVRAVARKGGGETLS